MTKSELHNKIGKLLKLERERQNLTLVDLSAQLKISKGNLEHIEAGNADALPSELYFNLFAKSYAETLGIDYMRTVEAIKEEVGEPLEPQGHTDHRKAVASGSTEPDVRPKPQKTNDKPVSGTKYLKTWVLVFALVVVLFFIFLIVAKILAPTSGGGTGGLAEESSEEFAGGAAPIDQEVYAQADFAGFDGNVSPYRPPFDLQLKLVAKKESWVEIFVDGDTSICETLTPEKVYNVTAKNRLQISIAAPEGVDVELNGQPVDLCDSISGCISQVKIDRFNIDSLLSSRKNPLVGCKGN